MPSNDLKSTLPAARGFAALLIVWASVLVTAQAWADISCEKDLICIHEEQGDDEVRLLAENRSEFPLTYTIRVKSGNMVSTGPSKITRTLPAGKTEVAFKLQPAGKNSDARSRYVYDWTVGDQNAVHDDNQIYRLPYEEGKSYRVIQSYGSRFSHTGLEQYAIDFRMPEGTPIHAARGGVVARVEERHSIGCWEDGCGRYANYVVVLHDDGTTGEYYHLIKNGALVDVGDQVEPGQQIALSGNTGHTTIPHLHFAVYRAVDWGNTQSVPVRFMSEDGVIDQPRRGGRYLATSQLRVTKNHTVSKQTLKIAASE